MPTIEFTSPAEARERLGNTGLAERVAQLLKTGTANRHPAGVLRYQLDLNGADQAEVDALQEAIGTQWVLETRPLTDGRTVLLVTENDEEKLATWKARWGEAIEQDRGLRVRLDRVSQMQQAINQEIALLREDIGAYLRGREVAP